MHVSHAHVYANAFLDPIANGNETDCACQVVRLSEESQRDWIGHSCVL